MAEQIRRVWQSNFVEEMKLMIQSARRYPFAAVDTEFPGFLKKTPRYATDAERYSDMKENVDALKIIQVGITLFNDAGNSATWEFNFRDFDERRDRHSKDSIDMLKTHGLDLDHNRREGIDSREFAVWVINCLLHPNHNFQFVFFHGLYDLGYLMKLLLCGRSLPNNAVEFLAMSKRCLRRIYDAKYMAGSIFEVKYKAGQCLHAKVGEFGLERLGKVLNVERQGTQHQAGSGSLLTASVFLELKKQSGISDWESQKQFDGILYGVDATCLSMRMQVGFRHQVQHRQYYYPIWVLPIGPAARCK